MKKNILSLHSSVIPACLCPMFGGSVRPTVGYQESLFAFLKACTPFAGMTILRYLLVSIIIALFVVSVADNSFCEEKPVSYTNDDIDKYRRPSDNRPQEQRRTTLSAKKDGNKKAREKQEQEYWCKRATAAKRKIEHAGRDVRERQEDISREQSKDIRTSRKMSTLQGKLKKAKDQLSSAEADLSDIENEAHRKGIRPGWLRCQFD